MHASFPKAFNYRHQLIVSILTFWVKKSTKSILVFKPNTQTIAPHEFEELHGTDELKNKMFQVQMSDNVEDFNLQFVDAEMKFHGRVIGEVVCCIKVSSFLKIFQSSCFDSYAYRIPWTQQLQMLS